jgi:hypothetical protein
LWFPNEEPQISDAHACHAVGERESQEELQYGSYSMRVFHVYINGKKRCLAGIGNHGVLSAIATWVISPGRREMMLSVGGLINSANEHVRWLDRKLRVGDEIKIKISEGVLADRPKSRLRNDPAKDLEKQKEYVRSMAKKFGWKIQLPKPD